MFTSPSSCAIAKAGAVGWMGVRTARLHVLHLQRHVCDVSVAPLSEITQCIYCVPALHYL